jgi:hypothetical protein
MKRYYWTTVTLLGLGLCCGCAGTNSACNEPRQGLFSRWFGMHNHGDCDCIETGRLTVGEGPYLPDPGCGATEIPLTNGIPVAPQVIPTMPPPAVLPNPNPLAQPVPAGPTGQTKTVGK